MTDTELREFLLSALREANVFGLDDSSECRSFVSGHSDIAFDKLDMDSLAAMEFCIALETETPLSITPKELQKLRTLGELVSRIRAAAR